MFKKLLKNNNDSDHLQSNMEKDLESIMICGTDKELLNLIDDFMPYASTSLDEYLSLQNKLMHIKSNILYFAHARLKGMIEDYDNGKYMPTLATLVGLVAGSYIAFFKDVYFIGKNIQSIMSLSLYAFSFFLFSWITGKTKTDKRKLVFLENLIEWELRRREGK